MMSVLISPATQSTTAAPGKANSDEQLKIDLKDALARARQYGLQLTSQQSAFAQAKQARVQARAGTLPSVELFNQFIYTEGNGTPSGVFVANDGVHVYNEQLHAHEELLALLRRGEVRAAAAAEAAAKARLDVAARGLDATVVTDYYAIVSAQRKLNNAQASLQEAEHFFRITQQQEHGGEAAHADVIKAQLQLQQRERDLQDAQLTVDKAKITMAVLIFPDVRLNYDVIDDLQQQNLSLPSFSELESAAGIYNADVKAAKANLLQSRYGVSIAKYAYLPSFGLDVFYGINANQFAFRSRNAAAEERSTLPNFELPYRQNLGYVAQATLTIPLWDWGSIRSKVKQANEIRKQAAADLTLAQRQLKANLDATYREAEVARSQAASLRDSANLAAESLRLTLLRYQAGEATALEVVDAQTTLMQARNAAADGLVRYRVALANLKILAGTF